MKVVHRAVKVGTYLREEKIVADILLHTNMSAVSGAHLSPFDMLNRLKGYGLLCRAKPMLKSKMVVGYIYRKIA